MNAETTYIRRAVLDIGLPEELREKGFEEMFRDALLNDLSEFIEAEIARRDTSGKRISIDTLSIDLGPVKSSGGREEFIGRFKKEFVHALDRSLELSEEKTNETDLLKFFLENGSYPWWASHASGQDLDSLVRALSPAMYDAFISWLAGSVKNDAVRLRLQGQLSPVILRETVSALAGPGSIELMDAIDLLHVLFHPGEYPANKKNAWGARWLLAELGAGTAFTTDRRVWLEKYIRTETAHALVTTKDRAGFLPKLVPVIRQLPDSLQQEIHEIAGRALQENRETGTESARKKSTEFFLNSERPADLFSYIARYGSLPQEIQTESREQYFTRLAAAIRTDRRAFLAVLQQLSHDPKRLARLFLQLGQEMSTAIFPLLFPGEEEIIRSMRQQFVLLQQAGLLAAGSAETEALLSAAATYSLLVHTSGKEKELPLAVVRPFIVTPAATVAKLKSGSLFESLPEAVQNMVLQKIEATKKTKETAASPAEETEPVTDTVAGSLLSSRYLSDLLDHFLLHKTLPWWGEIFKMRPDIFDAALRKGSADDIIFSAAHRYFARRFTSAYAGWARAAISHPAMRAAICWDIPQADTEQLAATLLPWRKIHVPSLVRLLLAVTGAEKKQPAAGIAARDLVGWMLSRLAATDASTELLLKAIAALISEGFGLQENELAGIFEKQYARFAHILSLAADDAEAVSLLLPVNAHGLHAAHTLLKSERAGMLRFSREEIVLFFTGLLAGKTAATAPLNREVLQEALLGEIKTSPQLRAAFLEALQDNPAARMLMRISFGHEFTGKLLREFLAHYPAAIREAAENILPALRQAALFPGTGSKADENALLVLYALPGISPGTSASVFLDAVIRMTAAAFHISPGLVRGRLAAIFAGASNISERPVAAGLRETERYFELATERDFLPDAVAEKNKVAEARAQWRVKAGEALAKIQAAQNEPGPISSVQEKIIPLYLLALPAELLLRTGTETGPAILPEHLFAGLPAWIAAVSEKKTDQTGETKTGTINLPGTDTRDDEQVLEFLEQAFRGLIIPEEISISADKEKQESPEHSDTGFIFSPAGETTEETEDQTTPDFLTATENVPGEKTSRKEKSSGAAQYEREALVSAWQERAYRVLAQFRRHPEYPAGEAYRESAFIAAETMALIRRLENRQTKPSAAVVENEIRFALRSLVLFLEQRIRAGEEKIRETKKSAEKKRDKDQPESEKEKEKKDIPEDPRELLFINPSIFLNALVYFFTWHSLPWWSPYKTAEELGHYASILIPKHRELVLHHLAGLFRQQETSEALSVLLADRLHETSETQELVAGNRLVFALLKHLAGKSASPGDDVFALLRTGEDIFFLLDEHIEPAKAAALVAAVVQELPEGFRENIFSQSGLAGNEELFDSFLKDVPQNVLSLSGDTGLNREDFRAALQDITEKIKQAGSSEIPAGKDQPVPPSHFAENLSLLLKPAEYAPVYRFIPLLEKLPGSPVSPQENDFQLLASVFAAAAIAEEKSIRQLLNPVLRRKQTEQHPFYQALIDLRNAEQLPDSYRVLAAEVQAFAAKIAPQAALPLLRWHTLSATVSGDHAEMNVYLLALAIHEMAVAETITGEAVADQIETLLETAAGEIPFLTSRYLESAKQKLHLFEEQYRNTYTATAAQLKKNKLEISGAAVAGTPEKLAVALARALSKDKDFLEKWKKLPGKKLPEKKQSADQEKKQPEIEPVSAGDPVFVFNAGLVLFWPFIGGLFRKLKYVKGKEFLSPELQERAVLLLQYCVDEQDEQPAEHLLPLNKLFCGLDPAAPLERWTRLEEAEKNEARVFVSSVKAQWPQMKNTSVATFLTSFIRREGMLFRKDDNWELQVQHASIDVLLKKLPWGVSTVKFPWSPGILFVKWKI